MRPILVQFPSRGRPKRFDESLRSLYANSVDPGLLIINAVLDNDDPELGEYTRLIREFKDSNPDAFILIHPGTSVSKIDAFNRVPKFEWNVLVAFSDDMIMSVMGWDRLVMDYMPEDLDWFLHFLERDSAERCSVMSVIGRRYFERTGYVYYPDYKSLWCDVEETEKARLLERYLFIPTSICIHLNAAYGHMDRDEMFDRQQADWDHDEAVYIERKETNFGLDGPTYHHD